DSVRPRRRTRRLGWRCGGGGDRRASADGRQRRGCEHLAHDVRDEHRGDRGQGDVERDEVPWHQVRVLPGRMKPDTVRVASNSFGWLTFTTLTRRSLTVKSFCEPSTFA